MVRELLTYTVQGGRCTSKVQVGELAARQSGCVTWAQLRALGVSENAIRSWARGRYLIRVLPRVYAVGHLAPDERTRLFSLLLHAGPGAALSHGTSAHWRGWLRYPVQSIHVSTPRRIRTRVQGVAFHGGRDVRRESVHGVPCTTIVQTLLDMAATESLTLVRRSLAQLDYERSLQPERIRAPPAAGGEPGAAGC